MARMFLLLLALLATAVPAHAGPPRPPELMLATSYAEGVEVRDYWVSEKLDGVRGHWDGTTLWTRGGYPVAAPAWFTAGWPPVAIDGELWIGRGRFEEASSLIRTLDADPERWRALRFMAFDLPGHPGGFGARLRALHTLVDGSGSPWLQVVEQVRVADADALDRRLQSVLAAGGEGLMLHHHDSPYVAGRSEQLLKYKPYDDAEARVVGHTPGKGKYEGMTGALVVERPDGLRFRLGSGLSDAERARPPPLGTWVTYRYNGTTSKGVPRFARFLRVRRELPPPDPGGLQPSGPQVTQ